MTGNVVEGSALATNDNWGIGVQTKQRTTKDASRASQPFPFAPVTTQPAQEAMALVMQQAGAILPKRDAVDTRIIAEVKTGTCTVGGTWGPNSGIVDTPAGAGGWPMLKTYAVRKDTDKDGMPDDWEVAKGLDPAKATDGSLMTLDKAYTNLEMYLNSL